MAAPGGKPSLLVRYVVLQVGPALPQIALEELAESMRLVERHIGGGAWEEETQLSSSSASSHSSLSNGLESILPKTILLTLSFTER